ncbi:hypothetical protein E2C01_074449 [Portunus trituberculatus]|uniref:Uncharacterized protein n=1 Tax=Portunus trituberculatus TaxID=210409 RepID=A0A5B7IH98_PORTR|nr:hypothetical protein [Portunus trituberculatus]
MTWNFRAGAWRWWPGAGASGKRCKREGRRRQVRAAMWGRGSGGAGGEGGEGLGGRTPWGKSDPVRRGSFFLSGCGPRHCPKGATLSGQRGSGGAGLGWVSGEVKCPRPSAPGHKGAAPPGCVCVGRHYWLPGSKRRGDWRRRRGGAAGSRDAPGRSGGPGSGEALAKDAESSMADAWASASAPPRPSITSSFHASAFFSHMFRPPLL